MMNDDGRTACIHDVTLGDSCRKCEAMTHDDGTGFMSSSCRVGYHGNCKPWKGSCKCDCHYGKGGYYTRKASTPKSKSQAKRLAVQRSMFCLTNWRPGMDEKCCACRSYKANMSIRVGITQLWLCWQCLVVFRSELKTAFKELEKERREEKEADR